MEPVLSSAGPTRSKKSAYSTGTLQVTFLSRSSATSLRPTALSPALFLQVHMRWSSPRVLEKMVPSSLQVMAAIRCCLGWETCIFPSQGIQQKSGCTF